MATIALWQRAFKWMSYHQELPSLDDATKQVEITAKKITIGKGQQEKVEEDIKKGIEAAGRIKEKIEKNSDDIDERFMKPINVLKQKQHELDKQRSQIARTVSAKSKFLDRAKGKIRKYQKQYQETLEQLENDERGRALATLTTNIDETTTKMVDLRSQRQPLLSQSEASPTMEQNESNLQGLRARLTDKEGTVRQIRSQMQQLQGSGDRIEWFRSGHMQRESVQDILDVIRQHQHEFSVVPIGPLGAYIQMNPVENSEDMTRNISIVQAVMSSAMTSFLVSTSRDQQIFRSIMQRRFRRVPNCIQYKYSDRMFQIHANPFLDYQFPPEHGPLLRVADMYTIKDNIPWVYNALTVNSNPERMFAHGTVTQARQFMSSLDHHTVRFIGCLYTYRERVDKLFRVQRKGASVSGSPCSVGRPLLREDTTQMKQYLQSQLNQHFGEMTAMKTDISRLTLVVENEQKTLQNARRGLRRLDNEIKRLEQRIGSLQREKTQLEEEQEDNSEIQSALTELRNNIEDEKSQIQQIEEEIVPFRNEEGKILDLLGKNKVELHKVEEEMNVARRESTKMKELFQKLCSDLKVKKIKIQKIPAKIQELESELRQFEGRKQAVEERINKLKEDALKSGAEVTPENYPRNPRQRNRQFQDLRTLELEIKRKREFCEAWQQASKPAEQIKTDYERVKPLYEQHQEKMDNVNHNVDQMNMKLAQSLKDFEGMKACCKDMLHREFRLIMRKQGHDGRLIVDYEKQQLEMGVSMKSHGSTQVRNSKTLSGGERSFTQVAMIMALQKFSGSPFCIYDEFDVFMDSVNRGNSIKILLKAALGKDNEAPERQYIFITPNDVSPMIAAGHKDMIRIHALHPPRKARQN